MKLSIIIPVYNIINYLSACVDSVLQQTFFDYEIILVDDGATDGSGILCDQLAQQDVRIRVLHKLNGGLSSARNAGLEVARGEYIHFLDGDDYYAAPDNLQTLFISLAEQYYPDVLLFCRTDVYEDTGVVRPEHPYDVECINRMNTPTEVFAHLLQHQRFNMSACFQLIRREVLIRNKVFFTESLLSEDVDWSLLLWQHLRTVRAVNCYAYCYRHRSGSITTTLSIRTYESYTYMFRKWTSILQQQTTELAQLQLQYLATQYTTLLYSFCFLQSKDRRRAKKMLKEMRYILQYSAVRKSERVRKLMQYCGFNITLFVFATYRLLKRMIA